MIFKVQIIKNLVHFKTHPVLKTLQTARLRMSLFSAWYQVFDLSTSRMCSDQIHVRDSSLQDVKQRDTKAIMALFLLFHVMVKEVMP